MCNTSLFIQFAHSGHINIQHNLKWLIREYGSTLYVGMTQVCLILKIFNPLKSIENV